MEDKVVLITGAASGIGRASAIAFAKEKCKVAAVDIDENGGTETTQIIKANGGEATFFKADVSSSEEVKKMIQMVVTAYGAIHFAHNNAGTEGERGRLHECTEENFAHIMNTNCTSVFLCMKYEIEQMLKQEPMKEGMFAICNTSSTAGIKAMPEFPSYCASKHAILGLTRTAAVEYADKIRINAVAPATTQTPMVDRFMAKWPEYQKKINGSYPMGRIGTAEEMAEAAVWICSPKCTFMTGQVLLIDGGSTC